MFGLCERQNSQQYIKANSACTIIYRWTQILTRESVQIRQLLNIQFQIKCTVQCTLSLQSILFVSKQRKKNARCQNGRHNNINSAHTNTHQHIFKVSHYSVDVILPPNSIDAWERNHSFSASLKQLPTNGNLNQLLGIGTKYEENIEHHKHKMGFVRVRAAGSSDTNKKQTCHRFDLT